jgi:hypothetical protein
MRKKNNVLTLSNTDHLSVQHGCRTMALATTIPTRPTRCLSPCIRLILAGFAKEINAKVRPDRPTRAIRKCPSAPDLCFAPGQIH